MDEITRYIESDGTISILNAAANVMLRLEHILLEARENGRIPSKIYPITLTFPSFCSHYVGKQKAFRLMALRPQLKDKVWIGVSDYKFEMGTPAYGFPGPESLNFERIEWEDNGLAYCAHALYEDSLNPRNSRARRYESSNLLKMLQMQLVKAGDDQKLLDELEEEYLKILLRLDL